MTDIDGSRLQVERDERNYTRANQLFENGLLSKEEYENSLSTYQISTNNLVRAEKALAQIDERLSKTQILAPFDCTVLTRPVSVGQLSPALMRKRRNCLSDCGRFKPKWVLITISIGRTSLV
jgi:multidrug efflux pump subunit AcrA (membrane-fusion protein)